MSKGSYEVAGFVIEDQKHFLCKYKIYPQDEVEIFAPLNSAIDECSNDIGQIYKKENKYFVKFYKIITKDEKELNSVHSGNTNPIKLPGKLPYMTMLRVKV